MSKRRRILLACYGVAITLVFLWVPWTNNAGYWWLWSGPQQKPLNAYGLVADARQRLESQYGQASDLSRVFEKWSKAMREAPARDRNDVLKQAKQALALAELHQEALSRRKTLSDDELLGWLKEKENFDSVFPEKAGLDSPSRQKLIDEWARTVPAVKEWNERISYSRIDYRRIAMEIVALTALCAAGFVLTVRTS
jgi:hypothetical protein